VEANRLPAENRNTTVVVGGSVQGSVYGDAKMLTTAFRNLIDNAIRYAPPGSRVGVGLRSRDGMAQVAVTDQGPGIHPDDQERVFERFYRIDSARSRHTGGTGLGLSIVKHVVTNHGGEISLWSQPGQGSTFTVRLPEMESAESAPPAGGSHEQGVSA
jgi:two-component system sensor histidine kinase SenX3